MRREADGFRPPLYAPDSKHRGTPTLIALVALVISTVIVLTALTWSRAAGNAPERPPETSASQRFAG
jgi:hypothetical protein